MGILTSIEDDALVIVKGVLKDEHEHLTYTTDKGTVIAACGFVDDDFGATYYLYKYNMDGALMCEYFGKSYAYVANEFVRHVGAKAAIQCVLELRLLV